MDIEKRALELMQSLPVTTEETDKTEQTKPVTKTDNKSENNVTDLLAEKYDEKLQEQLSTEEIQRAISQVIEKKTKAELAKDMLIVMNAEQQNALAQYYLECQKDQLAYRKKKERKVIIEETKANIKNRKIEALWLRYGYMYKDKKDFIPSKIYNTEKEIVMFWNGTSENFRKLVKGTLRFIFWGIVAYLAIKYGVKILRYLPQDINL